MSDKKEKDFYFMRAQIAKSVALCQPSLREIVVFACLGQEGNPFSWHLRAIAVCASAFECYTKKIPIGRHEEEPRTTAEAEEFGWGFEGHIVEHSYLVNDGDYGLISLDDPLMQGKDTKHAVIELPWPYDEERDKKHIDETAAALIEQLQPKTPKTP